MFGDVTRFEPIWQGKMAYLRNFFRPLPLLESVYLSRLFWTNMTAQPASSPIRLSISEAARLFGISEKTVRRAIATGELRYAVVRGRYKLQFDSVLAWSQRAATVRNKRDGAGIGQWVQQWKIKNTLYSPREPKAE
jgi:excisionase family DNA binding protein